MSRVLITGGAGFIGCRLTRVLLGDGHDVAVVDNLHPQVHTERRVPAELHPSAVFLPADVTANSSVWDALLEVSQPDVVVHLAAETGTAQSLTEPTRHASINVVGTASLMEAFERASAGPTHVVLASSRAVYGDGLWSTADGVEFYPSHRSAAMLESGEWDFRHRSGADARPVPARADRNVPRPTNVYAATKLAQEHLLAAWCQARDVDLTVLRLQNVYGPGQAVTNPYTGVLTQFARVAAEGGTIDVYEDGRIVRDFVFVDDVVSALQAAVRRPGTRTVDIGSGEPVTIGEVAGTMANLAGAPAPLISGHYRLGDVRAASCEIDSATAELGYRPTWSLDAGLHALVESMSSARSVRSD